MEENPICDCGNLVEPQSDLCGECKKLLGTREFTIGEKVKIIREESWQGEICTITIRGKRNSNMYWLKEHGWRRCDEIEHILTTE